MTTPTTQDQKYTPEMIAAQAETQRRRQQELTQAAVNMADDNRAAFELERAHAFELTGRINRARHTGHMALNDIEGGHVEALAGAVREMLAELEGDK